MQSQVYLQEGDLTIETEEKVNVNYTVGFEDEGSSHEPRKAKSAIIEAGKSKGTNSFLEPPEGMQFC